MATIAQAIEKQPKLVRALVILLGASVFLNYVDRGAMPTAAPRRWFGSCEPLIAVPCCMSSM